MEAWGNINGRKFTCIIQKIDAQYQLQVKALDNSQVVREKMCKNLDRAKRYATKLLREVGIKKTLIKQRKKKENRKN